LPLGRSISYIFDINMVGNRGPPFFSPKIPLTITMLKDFTI
jgi:hypothetical protein